ncbi:MAG: pilus assembly PilX family protein [Acidiferrobacterales bacterium]
MSCKPLAGRLRPPNRQDGMVLVIVLILLLVMTIIGLTAAQSTALEERMTGNQRDRDIAFQSAEYTLRIAQADLLAAQWTNFLSDTGGLYTYDPTNTTVVEPLYNTLNWSNAGSVFTVGGGQPGTGSPLSNVTQQPEFVIEQMPAVAAPGSALGQPEYSSGVPPVQVFRIYTLAYGGDNNAQVMLQAVIRR